AEQARAAVGSEDRYRLSFKDGAKVEVVAVSTVPTGPHTWWKPDGSPLAEAPVDAIEPHSRRQEWHRARVILVRSSGVRRDDMYRWQPTHTDAYWGGQSKRKGQPAPKLEYYEATFETGQADCGIQVRVAAGAWTIEASNDGGGGVGMFVNGHKYCFSKARAYAAYGRSL